MPHGTRRRRSTIARRLIAIGYRKAENSSGGGYSDSSGDGLSVYAGIAVRIGNAGGAEDKSQTKG